MVWGLLLLVEARLLPDLVPFAYLHLDNSTPADHPINTQYRIS